MNEHIAMLDSRDPLKECWLEYAGTIAHRKSLVSAWHDEESLQAALADAFVEGWSRGQEHARSHPQEQAQEQAQEPPAVVDVQCLVFPDGRVSWFQADEQGRAQITKEFKAWTAAHPWYKGSGCAVSVAQLRTTEDLATALITASTLARRR